MPRTPRAFRPESTALEDRELLAGKILSPPPPDTLVTFPKAEISVSQQADAATITLNRILGQDDADVTVRVATAPSPAIGVNLDAVDQTVMFAAGETEKAVTIPIRNGAPNPGEVDVALTLSLVSGPATVDLGGPAVLQIKAASDVTPPRIIGQRLTRQGIELTFSEPMDPATVQNPKNYLVRSTLHEDRDAKNILGAVFLGLWGGLGKSDSVTHRINVRSAIYDPETRTVTLVTPRPVNPAAMTVVASPPTPKGKPRPRLTPPAPIADLAGNAINGDTSPGDFWAPISGTRSAAPRNRK